MVNHKLKTFRPVRCNDCKQLCTDVQYNPLTLQIIAICKCGKQQPIGYAHEEIAQVARAV